MKPVNIIIREIREDHDLTQAQVAKALGLAQSYYSKYELGEYELPIRHLIRLSEFYHLNADYLLGLTQYQPPLDKLNEAFLPSVSLSRLLSDITLLDADERRSLLDFLGYLKHKHKTKK